jgi:hypothetical protein
MQTVNYFGRFIFILRVPKNAGFLIPDSCQGRPNWSGHASQNNHLGGHGKSDHIFDKGMNIVVAKKVTIF